jgi:hypothetical protein
MHSPICSPSVGRSICVFSGGSTTQGDALNVPLEDQDLVEEIQLLTDLLVVAADTDGPLDQTQVDTALGLDSGSTRARLGLDSGSTR